MKLKLIAITMGDPAGIGPEVVAKALDYDIRHGLKYAPLVIGSAPVLRQAFRQFKVQANVHKVTDASAAREVPLESGDIPVLDPDGLKTEDFPMGKATKQVGKASMDYVMKAIDLCRAHKVDAMVTAPINKDAWHMAGYNDIGHAEVLTRVTGTKITATMLMSGKLRVVHLSTHKPLKDAVAYVTRANVLTKLKLTDECFKMWGYPKPRIALAALNPHASDAGLIGNEEADELEPAVRDANAMGINVRGPFPADSVFYRAVAGEFDTVLALYHDQGHIAIKMYGFEKSVSLTMGLPFIRTSVDHGTAYDIAGKGIADARSMREAIAVAVRLTKGKL